MENEHSTSSDKDTEIEREQEVSMDKPTDVTRTPAADPTIAADHFAARLSFETDCRDVHQAISTGKQDFVLLDVRSTKLFLAGHAAGAINLPHRAISSETLPPLGSRLCYVVYCAGPHCNGADRAAARIAELGLPVKIMIGGVEGWKDEGLPQESGAGSC